MSLTVNINTISHGDQRYDTCGDWQSNPTGGSWVPGWQITVSDLGDWRMEALVAVHELVEAILCRHRGITDEMVTAFDKDWETIAPSHRGTEPGDHPDAPYAKEHAFATDIERLLCAELGVVWDEHDARVSSL